MQKSQFRGGKKKFLFLLIPVFIFGISWVVMSLWNAILPEILQVHTITYWQAMGLLILCRILFGGFHFGPKGGPPHLREKWMNMSDEEREQLKEQFRKRWGGD
ncbi:hypothetical protein [Xanthocytophaga agilis]|uniref:Uncharacterized protein n=1 Tax=Xanthocytophaga agilis TaxID=3048010 RepID=A0AAE3UC08_9BACT|nr:hypothetical protein [Xanthocytophaga agilis]MDJ1500413.1 hypothetical protein [Xanthocytophaga agilis]